MHCISIECVLCVALFRLLLFPGYGECTQCVWLAEERFLVFDHWKRIANDVSLQLAFCLRVIGLRLILPSFEKSKCHSNSFLHKIGTILFAKQAFIILSFRLISTDAFRFSPKPECVHVSFNRTSTAHQMDRLFFHWHWALAPNAAEMIGLALKLMKWQSKTSRF